MTRRFCCSTSSTCDLCATLYINVCVVCACVCVCVGGMCVGVWGGVCLCVGIFFYLLHSMPHYTVILYALYDLRFN